MPALRLDDFYREIHDVDLRRAADGAVDWDDVLSWDLAAALLAIETLCTTGSAAVPTADRVPTSRAAVAAGDGQARAA